MSMEPPSRSHEPLPAAAPVSAPTSAIEANGINVIDESERKGTPRSLFWPWCASNISVFGVAYGAYFLGFGVSFWQALFAGLIGTVLSFLLVGIVSIAGKRGSAPTMVLSRAAFGVRGNTLPSAVSYVLLVGWETVLVSLAALASASVIEELGWGGGDGARILGFVLTAAVVIGAGILGFDTIMKLQVWITIATAVLTVGYVALTFDDIDWDAVTSLPSGGAAAVIGLAIFATAGFGISWVNSGADYSRYLPRTASAGGVVLWTTLGGAIAPVFLVLYGLLLAGSDPALFAALGADPIGTLVTLLPTWYLVPFFLVALAGLVGGAVLDIYSSGLALLTLGLKTPRWVAAAIDGAIMVVGTIYFLWIADDFFGPFQGFLITLAVPIAAWAGIFVADIALRRRDYADRDLYDPRGRYGAWNVPTVAWFLLAVVVGWGMVTNTYADWLGWQGYLLEPLQLGGKKGEWAFANLGVVAALAIGFVGYLLTGRGQVARQEARR
ncbi:cytosine permease [Mumia sp. zg.B17]|uniref:purine-cytosine permease family protein n=1 Tax=Mumia sp. zg.B17 TaxID=2855446 RepID=UPI002103546E|nr:cytosine permease [Mumia sp. zg.B17]